MKCLPTWSDSVSSDSGISSVHDDFKILCSQTYLFPAPKHYVPRDLWGRFTHGQLEVSAHHPYVILSMSKALRDLLGYSSQQICGRSISLLFESENALLPMIALIEYALQKANHPAAVADLEISSETNKVFHVKATCSINVAGESEPGSCRLRIEREVPALIPFHRASAQSPAASESCIGPSPRRVPPPLCYRKLYNFHLGLEAQRTVLRQQRAAQHQRIGE